MIPEDEQNPVALPSASTNQALDLKHVADPTWALEHTHGYEPGQLFTLKDFKGVFKLTHFENGRSCFEEVVLQGEPFRIEFEVELARKSASKFRGTLPSHVIVESFLPATLDYMTHALDRCHVFSALVKASVAHGGDSGLFFHETISVSSRWQFQEGWVEIVSCHRVCGKGACKQT